MAHHYTTAKDSGRNLDLRHHDDESLSDFSSTEDTENNYGRSERDEVREVQKLASKDTTRLNVWRYVVTLVLLATAAAVTLTTYFFLKEEEQSNFLEAVSSNN